VQAEIAESREIILVAQHQHVAILDAIENGEGARAEALGREHARLARRNLDVALQNRDVLDHLPGGTLIRLPYAT
jgi:GntR family transcriptional regulator, vanillate catabolism transcriptional regulator